MRIVHLISILPFAAMATAQWQQALPATNPPARAQAGMTYDLLNGRTLLFGGAPVFGFSNLNDTWSYDGSNWSHLAPTASPSGRAGFEMVADTLRGVIVMYGGLNQSFFGGASIDETWEFDGTTWTQATTANSPGGLGWFGMAYDSARARTVVYGGLPDNFFPIDTNQTWEYDGVNWSQVVTANNPGPLENQGMCYSPALGKVVMYGGIDVQSGGNTTTWGFDGTNWTPFTVVGPTPGVRTLCKMVYDTDRGVCVLHGGMDPNNGNPFNDTWEFDGVTWTQRPSAGPSGRPFLNLAYDQLHHSALLFGGGFNETWNYGAHVDLAYGSGCPGTNGVPSLGVNVAGHIGGNFQTTLTGLLTNAPFAVFVAGFAAIPPTSLAGVGMPGCTAYATIDDIAFAPAASGFANQSVPVPANPALVGATYYYTGVSLDTVNAFGAVTSNTIRGTIGW